MKSNFNKLSKAISQILWENWDPLGVNDNENIRDEYDSYVPKIVRLKMHGADKVLLLLLYSKLKTIQWDLLEMKQRD